jgi:hypothetical protein
MASPPATDHFVEIGLESLRLMLGDLPDVAAEWDEISDGERVSWSLDWDQLMATDLKLLDPIYRSGSMTPDQQSRYHTVLAQLKDALPLIERLDLYPPMVSLEP